MRYVATAMVLAAIVTVARGAAAEERATAAVTPDAAASACRDGIERAVTRYVRARRGALARCHRDTEAGTLAPCDCALEPRAARRMARAEARAIAAMRAHCDERTVMDEPPAGLGAASCGGSDGECEFRFRAFDDGRRDNENDYLDCMLCLSDRAVDEMIDARYAGVVSPRPPPAVTACRARLGRAAIAFTSRRLRLLARCAARGAGGACADRETEARIAAAAAKVGARLLAPCLHAALRHPGPRSNMAGAQRGGSAGWSASS